MTNNLKERKNDVISSMIGVARRVQTKCGGGEGKGLIVLGVELRVYTGHLVIGEGKFMEECSPLSVGSLMTNNNEL